MNKPCDLLTKHRNLFLVTLLIITLAFGACYNQPEATPVVNIPVTEAAAQPPDALETYRLRRDQEIREDIAALEALVSQPLLDDDTRESAADQLQCIIDRRQAQIAIEGALATSSLYPCAAVVTDRSLTVVTMKTTVTDKDALLVIQLAAAHTGITPENVQIITAE